MKKHASLDELALLDADALKPRRAAKVRSHLAQCGECSQRHAALGTVPTMLASVPYNAMPDNLSSRLDSVLAAESAQRQASEPGTEASRGMLPERSRRSGNLAGAGRRWRMPTLSGPSVRALATAGAAVVVVGGGIGIATQLSGGSSHSASSGRAEIRQPSSSGLPAITKGASVRYGNGRRVQEFTAGTNFVRARLTTQVVAAIRAEKRSGVVMGSIRTVAPQSTFSVSANTAVPSATSTSVPGTADSGTAGGTIPSPSASQLAGCLDSVVGGAKVQLLEHAKFEGKSATIIVTAAPPGHPEHVFVVGDACSATSGDVLFRGTVPNNV